MSTPPPESSDLSPAELYSQRWIDGGAAPDVFDFLSESDSVSETDVREVCIVDLMNRLRAGESAAAEDYFERWPMLKSDVDSRLTLVIAECQGLTDIGRRPDESAILARHPEIADELRPRLKSIKRQPPTVRRPATAIKKRSRSGFGNE